MASVRDEGERVLRPPGDCQGPDVLSSIAYAMPAPGAGQGDISPRGDPAKGLHGTAENLYTTGMGPAERQYLLLATRIIGDFGVTIAVPVVVLALAGKAADERFGTAPTLRMGGFLLAAICTAVLIKRKAERYGKEYRRIAADERRQRP